MFLKLCTLWHDPIEASPTANPAAITSAISRFIMVSSSCKKGIFLTGSYDAFVNSKKERTQC
jgi:hypothetical protein